MRAASGLWMAVFSSLFGANEDVPSSTPKGSMPVLQGEPVCKKKPAVCKLAGDRTWRAGKGLCRREARVYKKWCMAGLTWDGPRGSTPSRLPRFCRGLRTPSPPFPNLKKPHLLVPGLNQSDPSPCPSPYQAL